MTRRAARLAWTSLALYAALGVAGLVMLAATPESLAPEGEPGFAFGAVFVFVLLVYAVVGAVVASRRPCNSVGWIFCAIGLSGAISVFALGYGRYALLAQPGSLPAAETIAWATNWADNLVLGFAIFLFLLFPDGRLLSWRWRPVLWVAAVWLAALELSWALYPGPLFAFPSVENPVGVEALRVRGDLPGSLGLLGLPILLVAVASLALRLRRARGEERQQIKWFGYSAALLAAFLVVTFGILLNLYDTEPANQIAGFVFALLTASVPVSAAIAILRHRLYDIDVLINRTLVYGALTASLVLVYVGSVVGLQYVFRAIAGGSSQLVIVASTLVIAALFSPLRRRIQGEVDRRFYRKKYDATRTLEAFSARLRDETDLERLGDDLVTVVRNTVQPEHVSLWLKPPRG